jgi:SAM-dependent methyltransferase
MPVPATGSPPEEPRLYTELADWWPLLSPPSHDVEEAEDLLSVLRDATDPPPRTLLELGCGGGSLAYHLKPHLTLTLTDRSPRMLTQSHAVNPECEHLEGDMTSLDLGRAFDAVLIHDAVMYLTDPASVRAALRTARRHCRRGGVLVILPDCVRETFASHTSTGGEDAPDGRGLRYLEWAWDPDPADHTFEVAFAFLLREADGSVRVELDRHREGLFAREQWLSWLREAGFDPRIRVDPWRQDTFVAIRARDRGREPHRPHRGRSPS